MVSAHEPNEPSVHETLLDAAIALLERTLRHENAARESHRINDFFDELTDCMFIKDAQCRILFVNEAFRFTFAPAVDPVGLRGTEFLPFDMRRLSESTDARVIGDSIPLAVAYSMEFPGDDRRNFSISKYPVHGAAGAMGMIGLARRIQGSVILPSTLELQSKLDLLSENEMKVVELVGRGFLNKQIAKTHNVSLRTVENRRQRVMKKLQVKSTAEMIRMIVRMEDMGLLKYDLT